MFAEVSFPISSYQTFSYKVPERLAKKITVGIRVKVPLGTRKVNGIVVGINNSSSFKGKIRIVETRNEQQEVEIIIQGTYDKIRSYQAMI